MRGTTLESAPKAIIAPLWAPTKAVGQKVAVAAGAAVLAPSAANILLSVTTNAIVTSHVIAGPSVGTIAAMTAATTVATAR